MIPYYTMGNKHIIYFAEKDCGYPPTMLHGSLKHAVIDTNYGATVTYICTEHGYTLHGSDSIVCTANGTWSPLPTCAG